MAVLFSQFNIHSFVVHDHMPNVLIPLSVLREGNVELSEFNFILEKKFIGQDNWAVKTPRGLFAKYPVWTGITAVPFFMPLAGMDLNILAANITWLQKIGHLWAITLCFAAIAALIAIIKPSVPYRWTVALISFSVFGTPLWHHTTSQLSNHVVPVFCITLILYLTSRENMCAARAAVCGLLAGLAISARPPSLFMAAATLGMFVTHRPWRKHAPWTLLTLSLFPLLTLGYNTAAFGSPWKTGYAYFGYDQFNASFMEGLAGLLVSPTCGLFFYSPFLILGVAHGVSTFMRRAEKLTDLQSRWILLGAAGQWILLARWHAWNGGSSYGARMMVETIPGLVSLIAYGWPTFARKPILKRGLIAAGLMSFLLYFLGTITFDGIAEGEFQKHHWDLGQDFVMQFAIRFGWPALGKAFLKQLILFAASWAAVGYIITRALCKAKKS